MNVGLILQLITNAERYRDLADSLQGQVDDLMAKRDAIDEQLRSARLAAHHTVTLASQLIEQLPPDERLSIACKLPEVESATGPTAAEAIITILANSSAEWWKSGQIASAVLDQGWDFTRSGLRTAISRLATSGQLERDEEGRYRLAQRILEHDEGDRQGAVE